MRGLSAGAAAAFLIAAAVLAGAQTTATGTISGRVTLTTRTRGTPLPSSAYLPRTIERRDAPVTPEIKNVVVYLKDVKYAGTLPVARYEIRQENETFVPRILAITRGSTVDFPNADPFFHNVFSLSSAATFNLGRYPRGEAKGLRFNKPGLVKVYCQIHSHMSASILVLDHPYFVIPELDGTYTLPSVPAGRYTIIGWHERIGERSTTVQVEAGKAASIDFSLPVEDAP